jgi:YD repeat-containing protein
VSTDYTRDAANNIISRTTTDASNNTVTTHYGPGVAMDNNFNVVEKDIGLPGDISLTLRPNSTSASTLTASITNLQGATIATVDADGALTGTFTYDPFGNLMQSNGELSGLNNGQPLNTTNDASFGWAEAASKGAEVNFAKPLSKWATESTSQA